MNTLSLFTPTALFSVCYVFQVYKLGLYMYSKIKWKELGYYVYVYIDPSNDSIFYIGKGVGNRAIAHLKDKKESEKTKRIQNIQKLGFEPKIEIVRFGLKSNEEAEIIEAACIDVIGIDNPELTNIIRGKGSRAYGLKSLAEVSAILSPLEIEVTDPAIAIWISETFYYGMDALGLYEATRGRWKRPHFNYLNAKYAFAVYDGVIQEVYEIAGWYKANSTEYFTREFNSSAEDRYEFVGKIADAKIRDKYKNKFIGRSYGFSTKSFNL